MSYLFQAGSASDGARVSRFCRKAGRVVVVIVAALAATSNAGAQDSKVRAQQLFEQGVEEMDNGQSATGCAKLRESLDRFAVANTLFLVAQCDELDGKLATALSHWQRGLTLLDAQDERISTAKENIAKLEPKVPRLRVLVPPGMAATTVLLDGQELVASALEAPLPVDPGKHTLVFRGRGGEVGSHDVVLAPGERTEVVAKFSQSLPLPLPLPSASASGSSVRTAGFVTLGIGGAALLVAGITGGLVLGRRSDAIKNCPEVGGVPTCPATYESQLGKDKALVVGNAVAFGIGITGVATGAVLLLLSSSGDAKRSGITPAPLIIAGGAGFSLGGEF